MSDTGKYHEFVAVYCCECEARVTIPRQWTSDVSQVSLFYYGNKVFIGYKAQITVDHGKAEPACSCLDTIGLTKHFLTSALEW